MFCNLGQDNEFFPAELNRYGPITIDSGRREDSEESNGAIFRPYLNSKTQNTSSPEISTIQKETAGQDSNSSDFGIGHDEKCTLSDLVDRYGIFWAHDSCLLWSRSHSKSTETSYAENIEENLSQVRCYFSIVAGNAIYILSDEVFVRLLSLEFFDHVTVSVSLVMLS